MAAIHQARESVNNSPTKIIRQTNVPINPKLFRPMYKLTLTTKQIAKNPPSGPGFANVPVTLNKEWLLSRKENF